MRPTSTTTISRPDLGTVAFEYAIEQSRASFAGLNLMPIFNTPQKSGDYPVIPREAFLKLFDTKRAPHAGYQRADWEFENGTYACSEYGFEVPAYDDEILEYDGYYAGLDSEMVNVEIAVDQMLRATEERIKTELLSTTTLSSLAVSNTWASGASCTPIEDVDYGVQAMRQKTGLRPNTLVLGYADFQYAIRSTQIKDVMQYTTPVEEMSIETQKRLLSQVFKIDNILVPLGVKDSAKRGKASSIGDIWPQGTALLAVVESGPSLRRPSIGRTMLWTPDSPNILTTETYRDDKIRADIYRVRHQVDHKVTSTDCGYKLTGLSS